MPGQVRAPRLTVIAGVLALASAVTACSPSVSTPPRGAAGTAPAAAPVLPTGSPSSGREVAGARFAAGARRVMSAARGQRVAAPPPPGAASVPHVPGHLFWGPSLAQHTGTGVLAIQSVTPALRTSRPREYVFAPTLYPPGGACVEVTTVYKHTSAEIAAFDWCHLVAFAVTVPVSAAFLAAYTVPVAGRPAYTVRIVQTSAPGNAWTASLYDHHTRAWDTLFASAGKTDAFTKAGRIRVGWDAFEFYSRLGHGTRDADICGEAASAGGEFYSRSLTVLTGGRWHPYSPPAAAWAWDKTGGNTVTAAHCPGLEFRRAAGGAAWVVSARRAARPPGGDHAAP